MIEINLISPENFLKIKETLTRCGIANNRDKTLYQSCHILQKKALLHRSFQGVVEIRWS